MDANNRAERARCITKKHLDLLHDFLWGGLPKINGSEKQIAWAEKNRKKTLNRLFKMMDAFEDSTINGIDAIDQLEETVAFCEYIAKKDDALFWINMDYRCPRYSGTFYDWRKTR